LAERTLTIRREFTSKVAGQVCPKEMESALTEPMQLVVRSLGAQMSFPAVPKPDAAPPE
jgi:hypothetical protein